MAAAKKVTIVPVQEGDDFFWTLHEHATGSVIAKFYFEDEAKEYAKVIERGGVFAGFTPAFMLIEPKMSVNDKFAVKVLTK